MYVRARNIPTATAVRLYAMHTHTMYKGNTGVDCESLILDVNATNAAHGKLARTIAAQSAVLLKNDGGVLPLKAGQTVAVVGSACDAPYNLDALTEKWDLGNYYVLGGSGRVINPTTTSIVDGIKSQAAALGVTVTQFTDADGVIADPSDTNDPVVAGIAAADVVVACGATTSTEAADRADLLVDHDLFLQSVGSAAKVGSPPILSVVLG